jgi:TolB-like protein
MFTSILYGPRSSYSKKLVILCILAFMFLFILNSLHAQNSKNNTNNTSKASSIDNKLIVASNDEEKQAKSEEKKKQKEEKALVKAGKKEKTSKAEVIASPKAIKVDQKVPKSDSHQGYNKANNQGEQHSNTEKNNVRIEESNPVIIEHTNRTNENQNTNKTIFVPEKQTYTTPERSAIQHKFERNIPFPEQQQENKNNKPFVEQGHTGNVIVPQSSNKVEQHNNGGLTPDVTIGHPDANHAPHAHGNAVPNEHNDNWFNNHGNHNHDHIGPGGYYHDFHQHDFGMRRHDWHYRYPFFTFYLGFDEDIYFPYDYLYYYPTDYVVVDSRLSVAVLPFTYENDETQIDDDITDDLIAAIDDLHRFDVISSNTLSRVMNRNDIYEEDLINNSTAKRLGRLAGADLIIVGTIERTSDHVTLTAQGIDPVTGEKVIDETATSDYTDSKSIARLVQYLAVLIYNDVPLSEGTITNITGNRIYLNIGSNDGLLLGTRCVVYREGNAVRHPYTGHYLGQRITKVGEIYIDDVNADNSAARVISRNGGFRIGDKIIVK